MRAQQTVSSPKGFAKAPRLKWMCHEMTDLCRKYNVDAVCMKGSEGLAARGSAFVERTEMEAIVFYAANELGIKPVFKKVKSTIAKDLGQKGKAKYLLTMDTSAFPELAGMDGTTQEAALAAWSAM